MASEPLNQAQGKDNNFINFADIKVVPYFNTNDDLARSICHRLNSHLKKKDVNENQPIASPQGPTFLVFRPTGRAGDEFKENVTPRLKEGSQKYLIIASSTKPTDTFSISDDDEKKIEVRHQTRVVIKQGRLVASSENYHNYNSNSLKKLAEAICEKYSNHVEICTPKHCCIFKPDGSRWICIVGNINIPIPSCFCCECCGCCRSYCPCLIEDLMNTE
ncbi:uncharacterized protein LOC124121033 [Haliotis rufescens]|uniref:uncharacterized protein LOC124121033 n=1 Tax=Haliotis rufescens TaxID=6454 RepID=UPI00201E79B3|nr:uncharacterized protein LOC124121033 [Haliotis rufescens]